MRKMTTSLTVWLLFFLSTVSLALKAEQTLPKYNGHVNDFAGVLSAADRKAIDESAEHLERIWFEVVKLKKQARG